MTKKSSSGNRKKSTPPTSKDAARIQSAVAKNTGKITTDSYVARIQRAVDRHLVKSGNNQ